MLARFPVHKLINLEVFVGVLLVEIVVGSLSVFVYSPVGADYF